MQSSRKVDCPYCGETLELLVDALPGRVDYVEDCGVCCSPMVVEVEVDDAGEVVALAVHRENE